MTLCQYGCGQEATHFRTPSRKLPHGKWTCSKSPLSCPAVKEKRFSTNREKYGAENVFSVIHNSEEFQDVSLKMRQDASSRMIDISKGLGFSNPETLEKANKAFRDKYGVIHTMHVPEFKEKLLKTNFQRYGAPCKAATLIQYQRSKIADQWLDELSISEDHREVWIKVSERRIKVDAFDPETNTIYEFHGNYWHGNPRLYEPDMVNKQAHKTMGELYSNTLKREALIRDQGFNLIVMWEDEYRRKR